MYHLKSITHAGAAAAPWRRRRTTCVRLANFVLCMHQRNLQITILVIAAVQRTTNCYRNHHVCAFVKKISPRVGLLAISNSLPVLKTRHSRIVLDDRKLIKLLARRNETFFVRHGERPIMEDRRGRRRRLWRTPVRRNDLAKAGDLAATKRCRSITRN